MTNITALLGAEAEPLLSHVCHGIRLISQSPDSPIFPPPFSHTAT